MNDEPAYALIHFSLRYRLLLLIAAVVTPILLIALLAWPGVTATMIIGGVIAGGAAAYLMQLFIEIINVIAETLLPR